MAFLVLGALLTLEHFGGELNRLGFATGEMDWLCGVADEWDQEKSEERSHHTRLSRLTRIRPMNLQMHAKMKIHCKSNFLTRHCSCAPLAQAYAPLRS